MATNVMVSLRIASVISVATDSEDGLATTVSAMVTLTDVDSL